jgi:hypothetical protein
VRSRCVAVFDAPHRRRGATDAVLQAFDLLELNGDDLRPLPLKKGCWRASTTGLPLTSTQGQTAPSCSGRPAQQIHSGPALLLDSFPENHKRQHRCSSADAKI